MTELSDYKRLVERPMREDYERRLRAQSDRIALLEEVLRPFCNARDQFPQSIKLINPKLSDMGPITITVTKGQFMAAFQALSTEGSRDL